MFSSRVPDDRAPTRLARALARARARARGSLIDLTLSNPTQAGIDYPSGLFEPLADPASTCYRPEPFGLPGARAAVAADFARRGVPMSAERIVLTASTSEAYSLLFKLLCDAGRSNVLTPVPSYPLFDHLTALDAVEQRRYGLEYHSAWTVDFADVDRQWSADTRAVLVVSPNNPTGSVLHAVEAAELGRRLAERRAALILDEVFCDYPIEPLITDPPPHAAPPHLTFRLGGLSKTAGLPQVKLGWIALDGPDALVADAMDRLELICDTYLSVSTPVQTAAASLLDAGAGIRRQILERVRYNYARLGTQVSAAGGVTRLPAEGGWSAVLRVPATRTEEELVLELLDRDLVAAYPGYFFDFPHEAFLVVSLLPEPDQFARGVDRILERVHAA